MLSVRKRTGKCCCYGVCRSGTRSKISHIENSYYFINFPKPCIQYRRGAINSTKQEHIKKCLKCAKSDLWVKSCGRRDGRFQSIDHITKNTYICSLHFDIESNLTNKFNGPSIDHPDPISRFKRKTNNKAKTSRTILAVENKQTKSSNAERMDCRKILNYASNNKYIETTSTADNSNKILMYHNGNHTTLNQDISCKHAMVTIGNIISASTEYYIQNKSPTYKYCIVPMCTNTTVQTPDKHFFNVPKHDAIRRKWCQLMKRDEVNYQQLSRKSSLYCCEDHFDLDNDLENYVKYKLMGGLLKLKKDVVPHKFDCQNQVDKLKEDSLPDFRKRKNVILRDLDINEYKESIPDKPLIVQHMHTSNHIEAVTNETTHVHMAVKNTQLMSELSYGHATEILSGNRSNYLTTKAKFPGTRLLYLYVPGLTVSENVPNTLQSKEDQAMNQQLYPTNDFEDVKELAEENVEEFDDDVVEIKKEMDNENVEELADETVELKKEMDDEIDFEHNNEVFGDEFIRVKKEMGIGIVEHQYFANENTEIGEVKDEVGDGSVEDIDNKIVENLSDEFDEVIDRVCVGTVELSGNVTSVDRFTDDVVEIMEEFCIGIVESSGNKHFEESADDR